MKMRSMFVCGWLMTMAGDVEVVGGKGKASSSIGDDQAACADGFELTTLSLFFFFFHVEAFMQWQASTMDRSPINFLFLESASSIRACELNKEVVPCFQSGTNDPVRTCDSDWRV